MPRRRRVDFEGAWHHVMNRGIDVLDVFEDDIDRRLFLTELRDAVSRHAVEVHGYALMTNHYHLLLHTPKGGLSPAMQRLSSRFTQAVNRRRQRDGPLFHGRFTSIVITDDAHLMNVSAYIHLNPVSAGLVMRPEDWMWSSATAYFGNSAEPEWLRTGALLEMLGPDNARDAYRTFVEEHARRTGQPGSDPLRQRFGQDRDVFREGSDPIRNTYRE